MSDKKRLFLLPALLIIIALTGTACSEGISIPIPASIGLAFTDEIDMSVEDLAEATAAAQNCNDQNYNVDTTALVATAAKLNNSQKANFNTIKAETLAKISENPESPKKTAKNCKSLNRTFKSLKGKKVIISG